MARVFFSKPQQRFTTGIGEVEIEASRVDALIRALYVRFPELAGKLEKAAVSIDGDLFNDAQFQPLAADSEIHFVGAIAGGSADRANTSSVGPKRVSDALAEAQKWHGEGLGVALATVIETWGSSPCPAGSQLAANSAGDFAGSVSGGCVESAVIESAMGVLESGEPTVLDFGVSDEMAWEVGLACGGRVRIFVERVD